MTLVLSLVAGVGVFLLVNGGRRSSLADRLGVYLLEPTREAPAVAESPTRATKQWLPFAAVGAVAGALLAQGDLFIAGSGRSVPALAIVGALGGYFVWSARRSTASQRRARRLRFELPVVADTIALRVVAGDSVAAAIDWTIRSMSGVAVEELEETLKRVADGSGMPEALLVASRSTAHKDGARLYDLLGHAHESGGRLATMLTELALDLRAGLERDLSAEGGKRAIATYGPILALMVPTALLFLLYPTLIGLRALSGTQ